MCNEARGCWYGLLVPRNTPPELIAQVEKLVTSLAGDAAAQDVLRTMGAEPVFGGSRELGAAIRAEEAFLDGLIKQYPLQ